MADLEQLLFDAQQLTRRYQVPAGCTVSVTGFLSTTDLSSFTVGVFQGGRLMLMAATNEYGGLLTAFDKRLAEAFQPAYQDNNALLS